MSQLHVRQIRASLQKHLQAHVDISDLSKKSAPDQEVGFLTRALAAFAVMYLGDVPAVDAAKAVTDGFGDNGLDLVLYKPTDRILYIVQSKWRQDGTGGIDRGEIQKFIKGFRDLINARWSRFNPKLSKRATDIEAALNDASTQIVLVIVHTGQAALAKELSQDLQDLLDEMNDPTEIVKVQVLRKGDVYAAVAQGIAGAPIDVELALYDWGQVRDPYTAFYGQVSASDVAAWFAKHHTHLFTPNIRVFLGATEVNHGIVSTLLSRPSDFWYFNNGITALCRTIAKKPIGGNTRETGYFECHDLKIVNGAQTVGAITAAALKDPAQTAKARVGIRLISLDQCPPEFDKDVTRYNNTQNRIDRRDFVALDPQQERIKGELQLEGVVYAYKSGESVPPSEAGFDLVEATVARACQLDDSDYAVQAKREIGKLWDDIEKPPYTRLFNGSVAGPALWRSVQVVRSVEESLADARTAGDGRRRLLAVHGNRFVTHLAMKCLGKDFFQSQMPLAEAEKARVRDITKKAIPVVEGLLKQHYSDAYLASLFKNASKCNHIKQEFDCP